MMVNQFDVQPYKKVLRMGRWIWPFLLTLAITCSEQQQNETPTNSDEPTPEDTTSPSPNIQMPRPTNWPIGTWVGTIPQPSRFAGIKVQLVLEDQCGTVTGSSVGYYYRGSFTWDYQGSNPWTANFQLPQSATDSYVWWVYDAAWQIETFRCEIKTTDRVILSTTTLGPAGTSPTTINLYLTATINGISETDLVRVSMIKQ